MNATSSNYTLQDMVGMLGALPFFVPILFAPGYLIGLATNVLDFRIRGLAERILLSLTLSCAISPYLINIACRFVSIRIVSIGFLTIGLAFLAVTLTEWKRANFRFGLTLRLSTKLVLGMIGLWSVICFVSLPDWQIRSSLYSTAAIWDHSVRSAFIASALRTGAPPANPFFYPGHPVHARYYYYWNVLCAIPAQLSGLSPRIVLNASCFWSGLCIASIIPMYLKHFLGKQTNLRLTSVIGIGLLTVTGLDLIPTFIIGLFHTTPPYADMEWWDPVQITSWIDSLLWVPHHVASLVACLTGYLLLWKAATAKRRLHQLLLIILSAVGFSSAAGMSVYVALTFALFAALWIIYQLVRGNLAPALNHTVAGLVALLISVPYLNDLIAHGATHGKGAKAFVTLYLHQLPVLFSTFVDVAGHNLRFAAACMFVLFLILTLFLEFGVYFAVGVFQAKYDWKHRRDLPEPDRCLWFMALVPLFILLFVRSTVIEDNDLAWRASLILQFVLLLWTALYISDRVTTRQSSRFSLGHFHLPLSATFLILLAVGFASSLYQLFMLRSYALLKESYSWEDKLLMASGPEAFLIRSAYDKLSRFPLSNAIVQFNPESSVTTTLLVDSRYQQVDVYSPSCATAFGGSLEDCLVIDAELKRVFHPEPMTNLRPAQVSQICRTLDIDDLVVSARDPVWNIPGSWVWQAEPIIQNDFVRIYDCRTPKS